MTTITDQVRALPRTVIGTTFDVARLPLTAAGRIVGQAGNDEWPPALALAGAEAAVETALGSLLHDEELLSRGRLHKARLTKLQEAAQLDALAAAQRAEASERFESRQQAAAERHDAIEAETAEREQTIESAAKRKKEKVRSTAAARKQSVAAQAAETEKRVQREERTAKLEAIEAESKAVDAQGEAVAAVDKADTIDEALTATAEARRSG